MFNTIANITFAEIKKITTERKAKKKEKKNKKASNKLKGIKVNRANEWWNGIIKRNFPKIFIEIMAIVITYLFKWGCIILGWSAATIVCRKLKIKKRKKIWMEQPFDCWE